MCSTAWKGAAIWLYELRGLLDYKIPWDDLGLEKSKAT